MSLFVSIPPRIHISKRKFIPFSRLDHTIKSDGTKKLDFSGVTSNRFQSGLFLRNGVRGGSVVCAASAAFGPQNLQWISAVSSVSEHGTWTAVLALLVRLFYFIPGELEFPFQAMLLLIVARYQLYNLKGTPAGAIVSLVIAGYLAYQHFSWTESLCKAFDQGSIITTLALICVVSMPCIFLF